MMIRYKEDIANEKPMDRSRKGFNKTGSAG